MPPRPTTPRGAARSERAALLGVDTGGMMSILFAATYPERTVALVLTGTAARTLWAPDHPWGPTESDVRGALPAIHVPTLVAHRTGDRVVDVEAGRELARRIPGARLVELSGDDHSPFTGSSAELGDATRSFLDEVSREQVGVDAVPDRILATVLFTDLVDSTSRAAELGDARWREVLERHNSVIRRQLARFRGEEVDTTGDGFFAVFDGPARAIRCAEAIREAVNGLGLEIRAGLHTGECEQHDGKIGGIAVHIGARVAAEAAAGEVLVSRTVKDLVAGSGLEFEDRGARELKGVPGTWQLYAVTT